MKNQLISSADQMKDFLNKECLIIESYIVSAVKVISIVQKEKYIELSLQEIYNKRFKYPAIRNYGDPLKGEWTANTKNDEFKVGLNLDYGKIYMSGEDYLQFSGLYAGGTTRFYFNQEFVEKFIVEDLSWWQNLGKYH